MITFQLDKTLICCNHIRPYVHARRAAHHPKLQLRVYAYSNQSPIVTTISRSRRLAALRARLRDWALVYPARVPYSCDSTSVSRSSEREISKLSKALVRAMYTPS